MAWHRPPPPITSTFIGSMFEMTHSREDHRHVQLVGGSHRIGVAHASARLRRMVLWAYLGLTPAKLPASVPYLRILAANETGRALLGRMRKTARLPVITKPAAIRSLSPDAHRLFETESRAADLYALAYPELTEACGSLWRQNPVMP